jgi:hypothetical protein
MSDSIQVLDHDAAELKKMGYEQELHRHMGGFSNFAISFSIICILAGGISAFPLALGGAGGASIGIGWLVGWRHFCWNCCTSDGANCICISNSRRTLSLGLYFRR